MFTNFEKSNAHLRWSASSKATAALTCHLLPNKATFPLSPDGVDPKHKIVASRSLPFPEVRQNCICTIGSVSISQLYS